jgi:acylphosphatase
MQTICRNVVSMKISVRVLVAGRVQGVGFRYSTYRLASALQLEGWVRNLDDGRVETFASGEKAQLEQFVQWLHHGPAQAAVEEISFNYRDYTQMSVFTIR